MTVADAVSAFARKRYWRGLLLLGAAAVSSRVPGAGLLASLALRGVSRLGGSTPR